MEATRILAIVHQLSAAIVNSCGWISDGSSHDSKVIENATLVDVQATPRGLRLTVAIADQVEYGKSIHRTVNWRMSQADAQVIVALWNATVVRVHDCCGLHCVKPLASSVESAQCVVTVRPRSYVKLTGCAMSQIALLQSL